MPLQRHPAAKSERVGWFWQRQWAWTFRNDPLKFGNETHVHPQQSQHGDVLMSISSKPTRTSKSATISIAGFHDRISSSVMWPAYHGTFRDLYQACLVNCWDDTRSTKTLWDYPRTGYLDVVVCNMYNIHLGYLGYSGILVISCGQPDLGRQQYHSSTSIYDHHTLIADIGWGRPTSWIYLT